jgi:hypothetical protein
MKYFKILLLLLLSITKSEAVPGSILLAADREIKEQALREHPLYQEGIGLALQAAHHRNGLEEQARAKGIHSVKSHGVNHTAEKEKLQKEADRVKEEILKPLREVFEAPSTPRGTEKAKAFFSGMGESVKDTLELPLVLGKFGITVAQSVIEWEDKLGLKSAYEGVKDLFSEAKKDWEDDAAYQARQEAAREYKAKAQAYEKAFNAAHYHTDQAKTAGYISAEALQFVFGSEVFKAGAQGVKAAGKGVLEMKKIAEYAKKIPKNWIKQPSKKGGGIKYVNPKNPGDYIRFSPANLDSKAPMGQQVPYFERLKDGKYLTKEGKWVRPTGLNKEDYHIPQTIFDNLEYAFDF